ncbi:MAG: hypothetical protein IKA42_00420 [Clostridia bacterium]|nr:hypothetical protein [Clostridia bacterium]
MKKKLLTVLLAVVMVFGVFGLTACGGSNKDEDYNYYGVKYSIEDEVKIEAVTFQAVYKMFTTPGNFVLYVNSGESAADYQAVNKLANDWDVTIYHFNPDLTGGYAKDLSNAVNANLCSDLTGIAADSQVKAVQDLLLSISKKDLAFWKEADGKILAIAGADSTVSATGELQYKGSVKAANTVADGAKSIATIAIKNPSYGSYTDDAKDVPYIPAAYNTDAISTMNLFADARLHIYDDRDAITEEKTDVFVTVANYEMFAHLMDNNEGYFAVFFGGTWCPNTQAILYHVNYLAKDYGMNKVYFFDPRLDDGVRLDQVVASTAFDQNAYNKDAAAAESVATIAKNAAATAYNAAKLSADKAYDAALIAAEAAYQKAAFAAQDAYQATVDAAEKDVADAQAVLDAAKAAAEKAQAELDKLKDIVAGSLNSAIANAEAEVTAAKTAVTNAENALKAAKAEAAKDVQYALDVKEDAEAAFAKSLSDFEAAKKALAAAEAADASAGRALERAEENFDNLAVDAPEATVERVTKALEEAEATKTETAAALLTATSDYEAAVAARKPAYEDMLAAQEAYDDVLVANAAAEKAAQKDVDDAKKVQAEKVAAKEAAVANQAAIIVEIANRLGAEDLSNVKIESAEDLAYVAARLDAIIDVEYAAANEVVADAGEKLADAQDALADAQADLADPLAALEDAKADLANIDDEIKYFADQIADYDAAIAAIKAEMAWLDKVVDKDTIETLNDEIETLEADKKEAVEAKEAVEKSDEYADAKKAVKDAEAAKEYKDAKAAYDKADAAVKAALAAQAEEAAKAAYIASKITYIAEAVAGASSDNVNTIASNKATLENAPAYQATIKVWTDMNKATSAEKKALAAAQKALDNVDETAQAAVRAATVAAYDEQIAAKAAAYDEKVAAYDAAEVVYAAAIADADAAFEAATKDAGTVTTYTVAENKQNITGNLNTRNNDNTGAAYNYNYTYGSFLKNYLPTYWSEWNITAELTITVGTETSKYTRMCVPNIMMFNGEKENAKAELVALAEAEYVWANTSVEGNPYRLAWEAAVKEVYDANPYATYAPIVVAPEASTDSAAGGSSSSSSAPAAGAGDSAC